MAEKTTTPAKKVEEAPKEAPASGGKAKTTCPVSRADFLSKAPILNVKIGDQTFVAGAREFADPKEKQDKDGTPLFGSVGYNVNGKMTMIIDGKAVDFQVGLNVTAIGSKYLPKTDAK